ncbi:hypothetical protein SISNIDRAFT_470070 [Sistotremastrum niveocremeum HHB9708]|uniref:Uncharacterized protein n=1 Tax=Sistotremastrum niveocremeum HHB9708 TaxID=1314777 RepID=A0A164PDP6_9AGAM|nr:hypothetical protein SISNIDRAFT_470070 [Sistotremastrum niveocremeum HHB9708]
MAIDPSWTFLAQWSTACISQEPDLVALISHIRSLEKGKDTQPKATLLKDNLVSRISERIKTSPLSIQDSALADFYLQENISHLSSSSSSAAVDNLLCLALAQVQNPGGESSFLTTITLILENISTSSTEERHTSYCECVTKLSKASLANEGDREDCVRQRRAIYQGLRNVFSHVRRFLPSTRITLLDSMMQAFLSAHPPTHPSPHSSLSWLFRELLTHLQILFGHRSIHSFFSKVLGHPLAKLSADEQAYHDFACDVVSTYLPALDRALAPFASKLTDKGLSLEEIGCGCGQCNAEAISIVYGNLPQEANRKEEDLEAVLEGRVVLLCLIDELPIARQGDLDNSIFSCGFFASSGKLLRTHYSRSPEQLQRLIEKPATSASEAVTVAPFPSLSTSKPPPSLNHGTLITTSTVGVQTSPSRACQHAHGVVSPSRSSVEGAPHFDVPSSLPQKRTLEEFVENADGSEEADAEVKRRRKSVSPPKLTPGAQESAIVPETPRRCGTPYPRNNDLSEDEDEDEDEDADMTGNHSGSRNADGSGYGGADVEDSVGRAPAPTRGMFNFDTSYGESHRLPIVPDSYVELFGKPPRALAAPSPSPSPPPPPPTKTVLKPPSKGPRSSALPAPTVSGIAKRTASGSTMTATANTTQRGAQGNTATATVPRPAATAETSAAVRGGRGVAASRIGVPLSSRGRTRAQVNAAATTAVPAPARGAPAGRGGTIRGARARAARARGH